MLCQSIINNDLVMFKKTEYFIDIELISSALNNLPDCDFKIPLNEPTGRFFYDPWKIKDIYTNTVWEKILNSLPFSIGEARIILLKQGQCYGSHADIDNRYHLNLCGNNSFLIDLENKIMHNFVNDGYWYYMNAGNLHTATNFGNRERYQLVVRELLKDIKLINPFFVQIKSSIEDMEETRFIFDNIISPWLNKKNQQQQICNFSSDGKNVKFYIESECLEDLKSIIPKELVLHYD